MTIASTLKNSKSYQIFKKWYFWFFIVFVIYVLFFWKPDPHRDEKYPVVQSAGDKVHCSKCGTYPHHEQHKCKVNCYHT